MDIIIKTGFEKIIHDIQFQPETVPKGTALFNSHHVINVEEHRKSGQSLWIEAQVIRQTSVQATPYTTKLDIDTARKVVDVSCTCVYNQSRKCKHIAALIYYVNHEESLSKTDYEQQWGKPSQRQLLQQKYCKGKYFSEMFPPKKNSTVIQCNKVEVSELEGSSALKLILLESEKDKDNKAIR
ncbi:hypothetical protein TSAR_003091 [Trichomalopsis sarcophagae]|uniref:SWIM-type domain-containing protein n=1 Tax=Trichomalopsis sarcophagae TaxID=543379 RepID=A0A232EG11_9HYME|nr:hypothetical protein TSAR_003091 [Trichomalopsis sarcophagae]